MWHFLIHMKNAASSYLISIICIFHLVFPSGLPPLPRLRRMKAGRYTSHYDKKNQVVRFFSIWVMDRNLSQKPSYFELDSIISSNASNCSSDP